MRTYLLPAFVTVLFFFAGCADQSGAKQEMDYEETKRMVIDILQTDEGKKALRDLFQDEKMKQQLVMESDVVQSALTETLASEDGIKMWEKWFDDPAFVETYMKATDDQQKKLFQSLIHDATFQKDLIQLMQDPELTKQTMNLLKSQQFKAHLEETIQETLDTPLFRAKMEKELLKAAEKKKEEEGEKDDQKDEEQQENEG